MKQTYFHEDTGSYIGSGQAFSLNGMQYPANWLDCASSQEISDAGLVLVTTVGSRQDDRYFDNLETQSGAVVTITAVPKDIGVVQALQWEAIKEERHRRSLDGGYQVGAKWFHSDEFSRGQQLGLVLLGNQIPLGLQWKTMDGTFVIMTQTLAQQILSAAAASDFAIFSAAEAHKAAMLASSDPASYDFSGDWPKVFGEE